MNKEIFLCSICNINSGTCNEDCKFCSQSVRYKADIERYKQKDMEVILKEAKAAYESGALGFCLVTADKGLNDKTLSFVCSIAEVLTKEVPRLRLIACNGTATLEQLLTLKNAGIKAYNHNLETSKEFYEQICTTHSWNERYDTCKNVKEFIDKYPDTKVFDFCEQTLQDYSDIKTILVGCEGGFSSKERELLSQFERFRLDTPMVLRSESAVLAVASKIVL